MRYTTFGKTNLNVSEMALGTWGIGGAGWDDYSKESRVDAIRAAVEHGVNFIDTAPAYNAGAAERLLGETLKDMGARKDIIISTKCGNEYTDGILYRKDSSPAFIRKQCEESLRNLQTDYIDIYLVHWPDPNTPFEETFDTLNALKKEGKILHIGVSNFSKEQIEEASVFSDIEVFQPQYSMVNRESEELIRWAHEKGMGIMSYGSLGGGILTGAIREAKVYDPKDSRNRFYKHFEEPMFSKVMELLHVMERVSVEHDNVPLSQIAINWAVQKEFINCSIVGAQSRRKVEENCSTFDWCLDEQEMAVLDASIHEYLD